MRRLLALAAVVLPTAIILWRTVAPSAETDAEIPSRAGAALLIAAANPEPVEVALEAGRVFQVPGSRPNWLPGGHRVAFRVPAAAIVTLDLAEGRMGGQRLGFELWSGTLDPVRPDTEADRAACRIGGPASPCPGSGLRPADGGRVGARLRAGEYALRVVVTNIVSVLDDRERILRGQSGINPPPQQGVRVAPCDVREDPELGMLVARAPPGVRHYDACGFRTGGAITKGRSYRPANFMKLAPNGTPKFVVQCGVYVTAADDAPPSTCEMQGFFGAWPLYVTVLSNRAAEWDATFESVRGYLARHTVLRTD